MHKRAVKMNEKQASRWLLAGALCLSLWWLTGCASPRDRAPDVLVTEAEMRAEYERVVALVSDQEYQVRHILVQHKEEADAALRRIRAGEPFGAVAHSVSRDPGSAMEGGDLGWNDPRNFVGEFSRAMVRLAPAGMTQEPVRSPFGWHVIEVTGVRKAVMPPFEEVKEQIARRLRQKRAAAL